MAKVHEIGPAGIFVPLTSEHAAPANVLTGHTKSADASEEIYKGEMGVFLLLESNLGIGECLRYGGFAFFRGISFSV